MDRDKYTQYRRIKSFLLTIFPHFRAIDIQALIGNVGGYIGLVLGYSLLQIPGLIISIVTQCKGWLSHIRAQGGQTKTKDSTVTMNGKFLESKIKSEKEGTEDWDRNGAFADTNPQ